MESNVPGTTRDRHHLPAGSDSSGAAAARHFANAEAASAALGWVGGYVDTAGFLTLAGLFTSHVTGNLVVAGAQIARQGGKGLLTKLIAVPLFMAGAALATLLAERGPHHRLLLSRLLLLETLALVAFLAAGVALAPELGSDPDGPATVAVASAATIAMGIQNALQRLALEGYLPTTVMTSNVTQFTIDLVRAAGGLAGRRDARAVLKRLHKLGYVLAGFLAGAASGAFLTHVVGLWSVLAPAAVTAALAAIARGRELASR